LSTSHRIKVLGRELQVKSLAPPESVRDVEAFVNGKLAEVASSVKGGDCQVVAILALMNIAEAYLDLVKEHEASRQQGKEVASRLLRRIDDRLG
jgi:cell division protein ZapA